MESINTMMKDFTGQITKREDIARFILTPKTETGSAVFTLSMGDERYTYKVGYKEQGWNGKPIYFVKVLTGQDNSSDYTYLGYLQDNGKTWKHDKKQRIGYEAPSSKFWRALLRRVFVQQLELPNTVEFRHEGRCGRCGRPLTVPESIDTGFGLDCAAKLGIPWTKNPTQAKANQFAEDLGRAITGQSSDQTKVKVQCESEDFNDKWKQHKSEFVKRELEQEREAFQRKMDHDVEALKNSNPKVTETTVAVSADSNLIDDELQELDELFHTPQQHKKTQREVIEQKKREQKAAQLIAKDIVFSEYTREPSETDSMSNSEFADFLMNTENN